MISEPIEQGPIYNGARGYVGSMVREYRFSIAPPTGPLTIESLA